jgi:putative hydrolase of the HAD superfamily
MLRAVTFDFWNTLFVDVRGREREQRRADVISAELSQVGAHPPAAVIDEALRTGFGFFDRIWLFEQRTPSCAEIVDSILSTLNRQLSAAAHARVVEEYEQMILDLPPEPMAGAPEVVRTLAQKYRLAVICDTGYSPGSVLRVLLERHGMLANFDYLFFSNEHGMSKPDVRVFQRTLRELGVRADEAAHIGDIQRTDIAGSQAAGMSAVHFVGANRHDAARSTADASASHFDELPRTLNSLTRRRRWRRCRVPSLIHLTRRLW